MKRVCFVLNNIGDYHAARLRHCSEHLVRRGDRLVAIEASARSAFYAHKQLRARGLLADIQHVRLATDGGWSIGALFKALAEAHPTHIFTIGYSDKLALACLAYAKAHRTPIYFMADSKADDQPRRAIGERVKGLVLRGFSGALVAGERHARYFRSLGMRRPIEVGYDVIDNQFFRDQAARLAGKAPLMRRRGLLPERYILCVSRFVDRKRIDLVLRIYAKSGASEMGVGLMVIGSGPNEAAVTAQIKEMELTSHVCHLRTVRNSMMPAFYRGAEALILASDYDQWGLCVNEAMALGVPCLVTERCGVAGEIVLDGETGFVFAPGMVDKAAASLRRLIDEPMLRETMSRAAAAMLDRWDLDRFTGGVVRLTDGTTRGLPA